MPTSGQSMWCEHQDAFTPFFFTNNGGTSWDNYTGYYKPTTALLTGSPLAPAQTPEPAALVLVGAGVALAARRRRKRG